MASFISETHLNSSKAHYEGYAKTSFAPFTPKIIIET